MSSEPPDPRSPRSPPEEVAPAAAGGAPAVTPTTPAPFVGQAAFLDGQPQQRPNIGSMLFLTAFFFFMSSSNNQPQIVIVGPDGQIQQRVTELDRARTQMDEYKGLLNGTVVGNWTEGGTPQVQPAALLPGRFEHSAVGAGRFYSNITGFHRDGKAHPVNLLQPGPNVTFFDHTLPALNSSSEWNATLAEELKGDWDWTLVDSWEMNVKERSILEERSNLTSGVKDEDWSWVRGTISFGNTEIKPRVTDYDFIGLHYLPNGTYELYAVPDGLYLDIRNIPRLYPQHHNTTRRIIMRELEKELDAQERSLLLTDIRPEDVTRTRCPLLVHLALPPVPAGIDMADVKRYDEELRNPTGLRTSLRRPPGYWQRGGLGGVVIADQCGFAIGLDAGQGMKLEDFWRKTCNYAAYASFFMLLTLYLLVRQMELTRTPSTLAQVSLLSAISMVSTDSFMFSAHLAVGTASDNKTSLPLLVPAFLALCTAIVFGPRYVILLYRVQAPERTFEPTPTPPVAPAPAADIESAEAGGVAAEVPPSPLFGVREGLASHPRIKWLVIGLLVFIAFQLVMVPSLAPVTLFGMYSFWVPQIWRNATRRSLGVDKTFVIGTTIGRLAIPIYALGCPDNVFFFSGTNWVWGMVIWQIFQVSVLLAQERFGPAFFLPNRFAAADGYNYHPLLPSSSDPKADLDSTPLNPAGVALSDERTCSICMEEVDTQPTSMAPGDALLKGIKASGWAAGHQRRAYALAPCGHLFHTACLAQWLAVKTICPLCKRSLPPL